jgi:hypothetical protein
MSGCKLTPSVERKIFQAIRAGNYKETACKWAGIARQTLYVWIKKGEADIEAGKDKTIYAKFVRGLNEALAGAEVHNVAVIQKAAEKQWQASAWMLERRHPERWGRNDKHRLEVKAEVEIDDSSSAKEKLKCILDGIAARLEEKPGDPGTE